MYGLCFKVCVCCGVVCTDEINNSKLKNYSRNETLSKIFSSLRVITKETWAFKNCRKAKEVPYIVKFLILRPRHRNV